MQVNTNETKRGSQSAATVIILANNTHNGARSQSIALLIFKVPCSKNDWLLVTLHLPQALPLPFGTAKGTSQHLVQCGLWQRSAARGVAKQDSSTWAVHPHPPQQPPTKARATKSSRKATECSWKARNVGDYVTSNSNQAIIKFTQELQNNLKHKSAFKACFLPHQGNFTTLPCGFGSG